MRILLKSMTFKKLKWFNITNWLESTRYLTKRIYFERTIVRSETGTFSEHFKIGPIFVETKTEKTNDGTSRCPSGVLIGVGCHPPEKWVSGRGAGRLSPPLTPGNPCHLCMEISGGPNSRGSPNHPLSDRPLFLLSSLFWTLLIDRVVLLMCLKYEGITCV